MSHTPIFAPPTFGALDVLRTLLQRRRWLFGMPFAIAATVTAYGLVAHRTWTATGAVVAQSSAANMSRLAGLAAQFGVAVPNAQSGQSPDFYGELLRSDGLLRQVLQTPYQGVDGRSLNLVNRLVAAPIDSAERQEFALRRLRELIAVTVGLKTGIVRFSVKLDEPELAHLVAARTINVLNDISVGSQQRMAAEERKFTEERLVLAQSELRIAEDRLEAFLRGNRVVQGSPQLVIQEDRLRRDVNLRQQVMVSLAQSLEQSRLEEVRNVPMLTVVEVPVRPALPDSRQLAFKALFAAVATGVFLLALALLADWRRHFAASSPDAAAELDRLSRDAADDLRKPWRMLVRQTRRAA